MNLRYLKNIFITDILKRLTYVRILFDFFNFVVNVMLHKEEQVLCALLSISLLKTFFSLWWFLKNLAALLKFQENFWSCNLTGIQQRDLSSGCIILFSDKTGVSNQGAGTVCSNISMIVLEAKMRMWVCPNPLVL